MNTPAHLIFGMAAFARPERRGTTLAAIVGALIPDLSLYLMAGFHLFVLNIQTQIVFDELYFSDTWQNIFRIDNSFLLWGAGLALAFLGRSQVAIAFFGAGLLHVAFDFALHHDDARAHFWPLSNWVFNSPISYWDPRHHGVWVGLLEITLSAIFVFVLWLRFQTWPIRVFSALLLAIEFIPVFAWIFGDFDH